MNFIQPKMNFVKYRLLEAFFILPNEIIFRIFTFFGVEDLFSFSSTNKFINNFMKDDKVWEYILKEILCELNDGILRKYEVFKYKDLAKILLRSRVKLLTECIFQIDNQKSEQRIVTWSIFKKKMIREFIFAPSYSKYIDGVAVSFTGEIFAVSGFRYDGETDKELLPRIKNSSEFTIVEPDNPELKGENIILRSLNINRKRIIQSKFYPNFLQSENTLSLLALVQEGYIIMYHLSFEKFEQVFTIKLPHGIITKIASHKNALSSEEIIIECSLGKKYILKIEGLKYNLEELIAPIKEDSQLVIISEPLKPLTKDVYPILEPLWKIERPREVYLSFLLAWVMVVDVSGNMYSWGNWTEKNNFQHRIIAESVYKETAQFIEVKDETGIIPFFACICGK